MGTKCAIGRCNEGIAVRRWIDLAAGEERKEAHKFLASMGLYLRDNGIFRMLGGCGALTRDQINEVQGLWDAEWDRLMPPIKARITAEFEAETAAKNAQVERLRAEMIRRIKIPIPTETREETERAVRLEDTPYRPDPALEARRIHRNRPRWGPDYPEAAGGMSEHHLYGPRGFKNAFKYEEAPNEMWAAPTIFPQGRIGGQLSYRPERPLADDRRLSIVTAGICGDPPKGRSALEARATHG